MWGGNPYLKMCSNFIYDLIDHLCNIFTLELTLCFVTFIVFLWAFMALFLFPSLTYGMFAYCAKVFIFSNLHICLNIKKKGQSMHCFKNIHRIKCGCICAMLFKFISLIMLVIKIHIFVVFCGLFKHNFIFLKPSTIYIILANYVSFHKGIINIET